MSRTFGIDLGTTKSAIGWVVDGRPRLLPVDGELLVPSVVTFPPEGPPIVGRAALNQALTAPERTIRSAKRWMGTDHTWTIDDRVIGPVEVSAAILRKLADGAEAACGERPQRVVITVPAWFNQAQRADTRRAGESAGLDVVRLINEPTAAALAHARGADLRRTALVYDFGGGTFDVSLVEQDGPVLEVRASHGDTWLGGDDVDAGLMAVAMERLHDPALADAIRADAVASATLRAAVEDTKIRLCKDVAAAVRAPFLVTVDGQRRSVELTLTREDLEEVVQPLFLRTAAAVDQVLADTKRAPAEIDALVLVGGSTALPLVWSGLFRRYGLQGDAHIPPREAVALGAAIQAAIVDGSRVDGVLVDVTPFSLSVGMATGGVPGQPSHFTCEVITPRNAPLPASHTHLVRTGHPQQDRVRLALYQGSSPDPRENTIIGEILLLGLPPAPEGELFRPLAIELRHDLNGVVTVTVIDQITGKRASGRVASDGSEQVQLRRAWEAWVTEQGLEWGDPYGHAGSGRKAEPASPTDDPEARALFEQVQGAAAQIRAEAPEHADALLIQAAEGLALLAGQHLAAARVVQGRLQDALFEAGVWL